jgi:ABC-type transport system involved in cytochrome bd biosynthesis fused ATPase/permease subunit
MGIAIRLKEVSFKYDGAKENVLENINLTVEYGETVLLSGVSGEGKSTLLSIINGVIPFVNSGEFSGSVEIDGKEVALLKKEFDILSYFMQRPRHVVDKAVLAEAVWGDHVDQSDNFHFVYSQVKNLRRKLEEAGASIEIKAVYGFGYKLID